MKSPKLVVTYQELVYPLVVGNTALLYKVKDHPFCHGQGHVVTSPVVSIGLNGAFETLNTLYVKEEQHATN